MNNKLFLELYNYVDQSNEMIRNLSAENQELLDVLGVLDAIDKVYKVVEREGLSALEDSTDKL